jgi:hypothetical protein
MSGIRDLLGRINDFEGRRVGWLAAKEVVVSADAEILPSWLESNDKAVVAFAVGYANARFYADGWDWLLSCTPARWKPETFGELATIFPFRQEHWDKVQSLGRDFANAFWCRVGAWVHEATPVEVERAAQELISRGRAFEALQCVHSARFRKIPVAADTLIAVVAAAKVRLAEMAGNSVKPEPGERFDVCHFVDVFEALQKCLTLTSEQRAKVEEFEWFFLPILEDHGQPVLLMEHVEREPGFFVEVLEAARFWPDDLSVDQRQQPTEDQKTMNRIAHMLLENLTRLPGIDAAGNLDAEKFLAWVKEVRRLAAAKGYRKSCEDRLGTMLLHSPVDGAGYWPCSTVCRLLSEDATEEMRHALQIAIFNNQGWPGPLGHDHMMSAFTDRQQAVEKLSVFAGQLQLEFPIVAELLRAIAKEEERFCQRRLNDDE